MRCQHCEKEIEYKDSLSLNGWAWCETCFKDKFPEREDVVKDHLEWNKSGFIKRRIKKEVQQTL